MNDIAAHRALLDKLYAARVADDLDGVMSCFAADATAQIAGSPDFCPAAARVSGHGDVTALMKKLIDGWEFIERRELSTVIAHDKAAVHSLVRLRYRDTGQMIETELYDLWTMRGDKVAAFVEFADTAMVNHAMAHPAPDQSAAALRSVASGAHAGRVSLQSIVDDAYAARIAGDVDDLMARFLPDAKFRLAGSSDASPGAMMANGAAEIRPMMEQLCQMWKFLVREQLSLVVDGENVAVHSAIRAKFLPSNEIVDTEFHELWTIRDGKIASLLQFIDTAMVNAVVGRAQANGFLPK